MNALVGIRQNTTGFLSPTPDIRREVVRKLVEESLPRMAIEQLPGQKGTLAIAKIDKAGGAESANRTVDQELGRDAFLTLLVLQLQNQDPLNPIENNELLAQLAQFTSLEQMRNLNESFDVLSGNIDQLNFISASELLGRTVSGIDTDGNPIQGVVEGIQLDGSVVMLNIDGGQMSMAGVLQINQPASAPE